MLLNPYNGHDIRYTVVCMNYGKAYPPMDIGAAEEYGKKGGEPRKLKDWVPFICNCGNRIE